MDTTNFLNVSISSSEDFSWVFCAYWLLILLLALGMIFHFNRLVGFLITVLSRIVIEKRTGLKFEVQSVKFSVLAGRVTLKNMTIIDKDQTVSIVHSSFTWRYWIPNLRKSRAATDDFSENLENGGSISSFPCRFVVDIKGLEVFIYNRTPAYLRMMELFKDVYGNNEQQFPVSQLWGILGDEDTSPNEAGENHYMLKWLPLETRIEKGAVIVGNKTTESILIASFDQAIVSYDVMKASNLIDPFATVITSILQEVNVSLKPNILFEKNAELDQLLRPSEGKQRHLFKEKYQFLNSILNIGDILKLKSKKSFSTPQWQGLSQYMLGDNDDNVDLGPQIDPKNQEYAKFSSVLVSKRLELEYYYDQPGIVPPNYDHENPSNPKYGLNVKLFETTIHYGPWAERQRLTLQQVLMPSYSLTSEPEGVVAVGSRRQYDSFVLKIDAVDDLIVRIPMREHSKHEVASEGIEGSDNQSVLKPFAWVELKVSSNSYCISNYGMLAGNSGYENTLNMKLHNMEIRSSVNHDILMTCKEHSMRCDFGYPLQWNGITNWTFENETENLDMFLLKEHITLLSDMFTDFASGKPTPYESFRPFIYNFNWTINSYAFHLNLNDHNIVNNPVDFDENIFLTLGGETITLDFTLPVDKIVRSETTVNYDIQTPGFDISLNTPPWHTLNNFLLDKNVGRSGQFDISGTYTYYADIGIDFVETIIIDCRGEHVILECYGFVVKYIMMVCENYFGDFTKFQTLEEYTKNNLNPQSPQDLIVTDTSAAVAAKTENEIDVHFSFCVTESAILIPENIYDCSSNSSLCFDSLDIDIRYTNYYMDMQANTSPITGSCNKSNEFGPLDIHQYLNRERDEISLDGLVIHGHRMFGDPPEEPTYFCKWDISCGDLEISAPVCSLQGLVQGLSKIGFSYQNVENHLCADEPILYDITNLNVLLSNIRIAIDEPSFDHLLVLDASQISLHFFDLANRYYNEKIDLEVKTVSLSIEQRLDSTKLLSFSTSLSLTNFVNKHDQKLVTDSQSRHVKTHDSSFHRIPFFLDESNRTTAYHDRLQSSPNSYSLPDGIPPLNTDTADAIFDDLGIEIDNSYDDGMSGLPAGGESDYMTSTSFEVTASDSIFPDVRSGVANGAGQTVDSIVASFGDLDLELTIGSISMLVQYLELFTKRSLLSVLDDLHELVVRKVSDSTKVSKKKNFQVSSPILNLKLIVPVVKEGHQGVDVNLNVTAPTFVGSLVEGKTDHSIMTFTAYSEKSVMEINGALESSPLLSVGIVDLELWFDSSQMTTFSSSCDSILVSAYTKDCNVLAPVIEECTHHLNDISQRLQKINQTYEDSAKELLFRLIDATSLYRVDHDPAVITRPAYIIRLSPNHVRVNDSWKVIMRLRHVLGNLPDEWLSENLASFRNGDFVSPPSAMSDTFAVFERWRSWEFTRITNSFIFDHAFKKDKLAVMSVKSPSVRGEVEIGSVFVKLIPTDGENNWLSLKKLGVDITQTESSTVPSLSVASFGVCIESLEGRIDKTIMLLEDLVSLSGSQESPNQYLSRPRSTTLKPATNEVTVDLQYLNVAFFHDKAKVILSSTDSLLNLSFSETNVDSLEVFNYHMNDFFVAVLHGHEKVADFSIKNNRVALTTIQKNQMAHDQMLMVWNESISFDADFSSQNVEILSCYFHDAIDFLESKLKSPTLAASSNSIGGGTSMRNMRVGFFVSKVTWDISLLEHVTYMGTINGASMDFISDLQMMLVNGSIFEVRSSLNVKGINVADFFQGRVDCDSIIDLDSNDVSLSIHSEATHLTVSHSQWYTDTDLVIGILNDIFLVIKTTDACASRFKEYSQRKNELLRIVPGSQFPEWRFSTIKLVGDKLSLNLRVLGDLLVMGFDEISLDKNGVDQHKPLLTFSIGNFGIDILSDRVSQDKSKVLEANLSVQVNSSEVNEGMTIQIRTSYLRSMLSPNAVLSVLDSVDHWTDCALSLRQNVKQSDLEELLNRKDSAGSAESPEKAWYAMLNFQSVHMLAYGVCIGFVFDDSGSSKSFGLIAGCDKAFVMTEPSFGKFSIVGAYLSTAKGPSSTDFFSTGNEKEELNRAFLPNMQLIYAVVKLANRKNINAKIIGGELDVQLVSNTSDYFEKILKSIYFISHGRSNSKKFAQTHTASVEVDKTSDEYYRLPGDISSMNFEMNYGGGVFKLIKWEDIQSETIVPSLELRSPAVRMSGEYRKKIGDVKEHFVKLNIFTDSSSNIVNYTCVPVIRDVLDSAKGLVQDLGSSDAGHAGAGHSDTLSSSSPPSPASFDFQDFISRFHLEFSLHIDKQELILSCEPSAKVQAVVGIDSIDFLVESGQEKDECPIVSTLEIKKVIASLQHSFSREVSGSIEVDKIIVFVTVDNLTHPDLYFVTRISDVGSYVNLKQVQDLTLFKDLWLPKSFAYDRPAAFANLDEQIQDSSKAENFVDKIQRVSTSKLIPSILDLSIIRVGCKLDLGQSLGTISLSLDRFWLTSNKLSSSEQTMTTGLDTILLEFQGRLSGTVSVKDIYAQSILDHSETSLIPKVLLAGGVGGSEIKISFDYTTFMIGKTYSSYIIIFNEIDANNDRIVAMGDFGSIEVYLTALAASTMLDIHSTVMRILHDSKISYRENLVENLKKETKQKVTDPGIMPLSTELFVTFGKVLVQVYPGSLLDAEVLVLSMSGASARFLQDYRRAIIHNDLQMSLFGLNISLSSFKSQVKQENLVGLSIDDYISRANRARGGELFYFPSVECSMETFSDEKLREIEFVFESSFKGKVDIRWNIGSISFIREMWSLHSRAFAVRMPKLKHDFSIEEADLSQEEIPVQDHLKVPELVREFDYKPLRTPLIEAPQLKELGEATPPLEWFGVNREKFPALTHQFVILSLQKLVHEAESYYEKVVGK
ncbi:hypothetical protein WICPIJ_004198 [Wickerhamomyces pijperi]|uniref:Protein CSF1 n=1 Tax=Wickerhamomyces pijperi TaxID=599730 RepID=A0A9P8TN56_WICPI|nr:hypothetical protein WICPIJ_004198 [Wickerhamomyces pijperi]